MRFILDTDKMPLCEAIKLAESIDHYEFKKDLLEFIHNGIEVDCKKPPEVMMLFFRRSFIKDIAGFPIKLK